MKIGQQRIKLLFTKTHVAIVTMVVDVIRIHWVTEMADGMVLLIHLKMQKEQHKIPAGQLKFIVHKFAGEEMPTIRTCGSPQRATEFSYEGNIQAGIIIMFETGNVPLRLEFLQAIITEFRGRTIRGGFKMDDPPPDGFGRWVQDNSNLLNGKTLTPRHASFIAAILRHEGYLNCLLEGNAVILNFNP